MLQKHRLSREQLWSTHVELWGVWCRSGNTDGSRIRNQLEHKCSSIFLLSGLVAAVYDPHIIHESTHDCECEQTRLPNPFNNYVWIIFFPYDPTAQLGPTSPRFHVSRSHTHTHTHGSTPLYKWSARRCCRYLQNAQRKIRRTMPSMRYEPSIPTISIVVPRLRAGHRD
jgi:hypothetical protein